MSAPPIDLARTCSALEQVSTQLAEMVRPPADMSTRCPKSQWTVGENAAHLAYANGAFASLARGIPFVHGDGTPASLAAANAAALQRHPERDGARSAEGIESGAKDLVATLGSHRDLGRLADTPMGSMSVGVMGSYVLTHMLMHGAPMAKALGQPNPMRQEYLELMLPFFAYAMPKTVDRSRVGNLTACYQLHFAGGGELALMFDDGELVTAVEPTRRVDCHVWAEPRAFLDVVIGQKSQYTAIAQGKLLTWGLKPWLALQLVGFFDVP